MCGGQAWTWRTWLRRRRGRMAANQVAAAEGDAAAGVGGAEGAGALAVSHGRWGGEDERHTACWRARRRACDLTLEQKSCAKGGVRTARVGVRTLGVRTAEEVLEHCWNAV